MKFGSDGENVFLDPEVGEGADGVLEFFVFDRFDEVCVDAEFISAANVSEIARGGEHQDGQRAEAGLGPNPLQHFQSGVAGNFDIDKKHVEFARECTEENSRVDMRLEVSMIPPRIRKALN